MDAGAPRRGPQPGDRRGGGGAPGRHEDLRRDARRVHRPISRAIAIGNVSLTQGANHINADRAEFDTETGFGTFFNASGSASIADRVSRDLFGGQEPDVYFYGETIERIGQRRYKVTRGGFTTCVQPTPRWQLVTGSVVLNLDHYAFARNTLLKVKGVPVLYLPGAVLPDQQGGPRDRLPDAGLRHRDDHGLHAEQRLLLGDLAEPGPDGACTTGSPDRARRSAREYRYVRGAGSDGNARFRFLSEHERSYAYGGVTQSYAPRRSYELTASVAQALPWRLTRARAT